MNKTFTVYYPFLNGPVTGGDFVNVDHINMLNRLGINAKALLFTEYLNPPPEAINTFQCPAILFDENLPFSEKDVFIAGEVQGFFFAAQTINGTPIKNVILHNQNPFLTYLGFPSIQSMNAHPFKSILAPSHYTQNYLERLGVEKTFYILPPYIPDYFKPAEKARKPIKVVFSARKRQNEIGIILFHIASYYHNKYQVIFTNLEGLPREKVAEEMAEAAVFISLAERESVGLMALEAMACGCHVVGFSGYTDFENADSFDDRHGDFVKEGEYIQLAQALIAAVDQFAENKPSEKVKAALELVNTKYRRQHFEQNFKTVFSQLLGIKL